MRVFEMYWSMSDKSPGVSLMLQLFSHSVGSLLGPMTGSWPYNDAGYWFHLVH